MKKQYTIGIDIGGTNMKAVLFNGDKIIMDYSLATPKDTLDHLIIMLIALIDPLKEKAEELKSKIEGIGLSVAGVHDFKNEKIDNSPNIPILNGVKLAEKLKEKVNISVRMDNDANCFTRAEAKLGVAKKYTNIYGITLGTGIGGAWWFNNEAYQGAHGGAGEPSKMIIDFTDSIGLEQAYQKLNQHNSINLANEAYSGDILAQKAYDEIGCILGVACANIVNLIDPEIIIIGGGVIKSSDLFFSQIKKSCIKNIHSENAKKVKIVKAKLGDDAGAIGAALLFE